METPKSCKAAKVTWLLRSSTIVLFGSSTHSYRNVSEQKRCAGKSRMTRSLISLTKLCKEQLGRLTYPASSTLPQQLPAGRFRARAPCRKCRQGSDTAPAWCSKTVTAGLQIWKATVFPPSSTAELLGSCLKAQYCSYSTGLGCLVPFKADGTFLKISCKVFWKTLLLKPVGFLPSHLWDLSRITGV